MLQQRVRQPHTPNDLVFLSSHVRTYFAYIEGMRLFHSFKQSRHAWASYQRSLFGRRKINAVDFLQKIMCKIMNYLYYVVLCRGGRFRFGGVRTVAAVPAGTVMQGRLLTFSDAITFEFDDELCGRRRVLFFICKSCMMCKESIPPALTKSHPDDHTIDYTFLPRIARILPSTPPILVCVS
jgi:hypothetical protein